MSFYRWADCPGDVQAQVDYLVTFFRNNISSLTGIYLHGSLAMGCFNPACSDLDLLVVTRQKIAPAAIPSILRCLLEQSKKPIPIEISFLNQQELIPWTHPAPYDIHYSEGWRAQVINELEDGSWMFRFNSPKCDRDLAAHITITRKYGICLWGEEIEAVFPEVPLADFTDSIFSDAEWIGERMSVFPVYTVLNLCRVYAFMKDGLICSKAEGARWAMLNLDQKWHNTIAKGLHNYQTEPPGLSFTEAEIKMFYNEMANIIRQSKIDPLHPVPQNDH